MELHFFSWIVKFINLMHNPLTAKFSVMVCILNVIRTAAVDGLENKAFWSLSGTVHH